MYTEKQFNLKSLGGLSERQIGEHLKLYAGYVKNLNGLMEKLDKMRAEPSNDAYVMAELRRRIGFEFNGMRLHELYFEQLGGNGVLPDSSELKKALAKQFESFKNWLIDFKAAGMMRGIGWAILYYDEESNRFFNSWISDHEFGHLASQKVVVALDVWEHAFLFDYLPAQRKDYIEAFFSNLDWDKIENRFSGSKG